MSSELGSLDDVLSDDELINALADRRYNDIDGADELTATLATWCSNLDAEPSAATIPTADLAEAAARRRSLRRTGRSLAAAAAVAVVCVGGLTVSKLAMSSHDRPTTVDTAAASASQQARAQIWQQLGEARTALMQKDWAGAQQLIDAARSELPSVSVADGRAALTSWVSLLAEAVQEHASLSPDSVSGDHEVAPRQVYNGGVPLPPGMASQTPTETASSTLPMLPTTLPTLQPTQAGGQLPGTASPSATVAPTTPRASRPGPTTGPTTAPSTHPSRTTSPSKSPTSSSSASSSPTESKPTLPVGPNPPSPAPRVLLPLPSNGLDTTSASAGTTPSATPTTTPTSTQPSAN